MSRIIVSEYVGAGHPDKMADQVSDAILDECLRQDPNTRAGIEVLLKDNIIVLGGEITTGAKVNYDDIARNVVDNLHFPEYHGLSYDKLKVINLIGKQSQEINNGVDISDDEIGAGDQGFCVGFASNETDVFMPLGIYLAKTICLGISKRNDLGYGPDTKAQVIVNYDDNGNAESIVSILVSTMHQNSLCDVRIQVKDLICTNEIGIEAAIFDKFIATCKNIQVNPCGEWHIGGPISDCGVTGRKIVVDQYGGYCNVGGGNLHGKDMTKVDRSAAYMARYIAKNIVAAGLASTAKVEISYMIGIAEPSSVNILMTDAKVSDDAIKALLKEHNILLTPKGIIDRFDGTSPKYYNTALNGHYGVNGKDETYPWEKLDLVPVLRTLL